jgi:hypothetical protein
LVAKLYPIFKIPRFTGIYFFGLGVEKLWYTVMVSKSFTPALPR